MKVPAGFTGPVLFAGTDRALPKLSHDQKALLKQLTTELAHIVPKSVAKSSETARLATNMVLLLGMTENTAHNLYLLFVHVRFFQLAQQGRLVSHINRLKSNNKPISLIGMDNYLKTTCYLDSVLVSMFHCTQMYDFLLDAYNDSNLSPQLQQEVEELKVMLRFVVNLMRSGQHIHENIMHQLLMVLDSLGCDIALSGQQQDSLQVFTFLVECLSLPLLTFKLAVIHRGKLNVADDLRVIEERVLLISVPHDESPKQVLKYGNIKQETSTKEVPEEKPDEESQEDNSNSRDEAKEKIGAEGDHQEEKDEEEPPVALESCLDTYFNNSVTVKRVKDSKLDILDDDQLGEMDHYQRLGILKRAEDMAVIDTFTSTPTPPPMSVAETATGLTTVGISPASSLETTVNEPAAAAAAAATTSARASTAATSPVSTSRSTVSTSTSQQQQRQQQQQPQIQATATTGTQGSNPNSTSTDNPSSPTLDSILNFAASTITNTTNDTNDSTNSYRHVTDRISHQRTRSSTIATKLNTIVPTPTMRITRRASSISNTEVSLPAWMYMQILPYYADPNVKLTVENHEDFYRSRTHRSKTIDSTQFDHEDPKSPPLSREAHLSEFECRYGSRRPIVPICIKRYQWDAQGKMSKIKRKVLVPEIIKYPFFISEDRTKIGYVDFKRMGGARAPGGSFMLVLQSCICHRGGNVNSGHYVSYTRKDPFDIGSYLQKGEDTDPEKSQWVLFNDLLDNKAKVVTFQEAMDTDDAYILFYEIVELNESSTGAKNIIKPDGSNSHFWSTSDDEPPTEVSVKQFPHLSVSTLSPITNIVNGNGNSSVDRKFSIISGLSEGTIQGEKNTQSASNSQAPSLTGIAILDKMSIGLTKSRTRVLDDVLDDYWFNRDPFTPLQSVTMREASANGSTATSSTIASQQLVIPEPNTENNEDEDYEEARVLVKEVTGSQDTTLDSIDSAGKVEYETETISKPNHLKVPTAIFGKNKGSRLENVLSNRSVKSNDTVLNNTNLTSTTKKKKHSGLGKMLKKVFN